VTVSSFHVEVVKFVLSPFMAHKVLEGDCKFCHDCVPYEFVHFVPSVSDVSADHFDLVIDPIANFRASYEGEEEHSVLKCHGHDPGLIV
jgi:hypothetical protein